MTRIRTQISVHMENRPGALAELTAALHGAGVNVLAICVPDAGEYGTVRVVTDDPLRAREALEDAGLAHAAADVLEVDLPHKPGALDRMAQLLAEGQVVVRYAYATNSEGADRGACILQVDDIHRAQEILKLKLA